MTSQHAGTLEVGTILDERFKILEHVADGGMAAVYRARELETARILAVKLLHHRFLGDEEAIARFEREAEIASRLHHPGIIHIYGHGSDSQGRFYLAMEWLEGYSIDELIEREGPLFPDYASWLVLQVAHCLAYSHQQGILHRDLKPDNIFVVEGASPAEDQIKVLDFGIGKILNDPSLEALTMVGTVCGTPEYMSPEQCRGKVMDARTDLYSLGCVFYAMLSGQPPFQGNNFYHVMIQHQTDPLPPFPDDIPAGLTAIITQATAKKREDRQASLSVFVQQLQAFMSGDANAQVEIAAEKITAPDPKLHSPGAMRTSTQLKKLTPEMIAKAAEPRNQLAYLRDRSSGSVQRLDPSIVEKLRSSDPETVAEHLRATEKLPSVKSPKPHANEKHRATTKLSSKPAPTRLDLESPDAVPKYLIPLIIALIILVITMILALSF